MNVTNKLYLKKSLYFNNIHDKLITRVSPSENPNRDN